MSVMTIPWGAVHTFRAPILKAAATDFALAADYTPAVGDVKVSKDGGAFANIATLPTFIAGSGTLVWTLSANETEASEVIIQVIDTNATKGVQDQMFRLQTTKVGALLVGRIGSVAGTAVTLAAGFGHSTVTDFYKGSVLSITNGTGANQARIITAYNGATRVATIDSAFATAPVAGDNFAIFAQGLLPAETSAQTQAAVTSALTLYGASTLTAGQASAAVLAETIETGYSLKSMMRIMSAILLGKVSGVGTTTETWRNVNDTKNRVTVNFPSVASGNRSSVGYDITD